MENNNLSIETIDYLQNLIKVSVPENKKELFLKQISHILSHIKEITSIELSEIESHKSKNDNYLRDDIAIQIDNHFAIASKNTDDKLGDYYKVSQVIK